MSMLSSQIAELRELAADADVYGDTRHFRDPLEQAADTIWQLRDDLQRANAENAKLRELIVRCCDCESACDHYEGMDVWWCEYLQRYVGSNGFCFWSVRRKDA